MTDILSTLTVEARRAVADLEVEARRLADEHVHQLDALKQHVATAVANRDAALEALRKQCEAWSAEVGQARRERDEADDVRKLTFAKLIEAQAQLSEHKALHVQLDDERRAAIKERDEAVSDARLGRELVAALTSVAGDGGVSEGAVDCARRIIKERDEARARAEEYYADAERWARDAEEAERHCEVYRQTIADANEERLSTAQECDVRLSALTKERDEARDETARQSWHEETRVTYARDAGWDDGHIQARAEIAAQFSDEDVAHVELAIGDANRAGYPAIATTLRQILAVIRPVAPSNRIITLSDKQFRYDVKWVTHDGTCGRRRPGPLRFEDVAGDPSSVGGASAQPTGGTPGASSETASPSTEEASSFVATPESEPRCPHGNRIEPMWTCLYCAGASGVAKALAGEEP